MEEHICKYCGVPTKEPDENCYKYKPNNAESGTIEASQLERMVITEACDKCKTILGEKYHETWERCVPIRLGDLYRGMKL